MRLFEAILEANQRAAAGDAKAGLHIDEFANALPVVALTCIDPRLNPLMPEVLGLPEEHFIWLRNAGNIITSSTSSTMRSLALACAIKGGKEIAIIGHTDCKVRQTSMVELTDRFRALGIARTRLPDNLNEFFGLFASERQNVMRAVDFVRQSPLIGPKIPVHGLLVDLQTGKLEWLVNGYQALETATPHPAAAPQAAPATGPLAALPEFQMGEMKFPEFKIGETLSAPTPRTEEPIGQPTTPTPEVKEATPQPARPATPAFDPLAMFKVLGADRKVYGPVSGKEVQEWLAEGRIKLETLAQRLGYQDWKPLQHFLHPQGPHSQEPPKIPLPPALQPALRLLKGKKFPGGRKR